MWQKSSFSVAANPSASLQYFMSPHLFLNTQETPSSIQTWVFTPQRNFLDQNQSMEADFIYIFETQLKRIAIDLYFIKQYTPLNYTLFQPFLVSPPTTPRPWFHIQNWQHKLLKRWVNMQAICFLTKSRHLNRL